jgi:hypothetical protein
MNKLQWDSLSPEERLLAEQAVLGFRALRKACVEAPHGRVLAVAERMAVSQGREAMRRTMETALQLEAAEAEKKGVSAEAANTVRSPEPTAVASAGKSSRRPGR